MQTLRVMRRLAWAATGLVASAWMVISTGTASAAFVTINDAADGLATSTTGNAASFNSLAINPTSLSIRQFTGTAIDRSILDFNLGSVPVGSTITSATLTFNEVGFTTNAGGRVVDILGFGAVGAPTPVTLADATAGATMLGSYDSTALGLGSHTVTLSALALQGLLNSGTLKLRLQGETENVNTQIDGLAAGVANAPQLTINFSPAAVPEPASIVNAGLALAMLGGWRLRRRLAPHA